MEHAIDFIWDIGRFIWAVIVTGAGVSVLWAGIRLIIHAIKD